MRFNLPCSHLKMRYLGIVFGLLQWAFVPTTICAESAPANTSVVIKAGSGFAVNKNGYILTASHVIPDKGEITVYSSTYPEGLSAKVIKVDRILDLAILKVNETTKPLSIAKWSTVPNGLLIFSLGYPTPDILGRDLKITSGLINALEGIDKRPGLLQFSAPIQSGNSGGPIVSSDLNVIGVIQGKFDSTVRSNNSLQNVNLAIQSKIVEEFLTAAKVEFSSKAFNSNLVKPSQVVYAESEASLFMVLVSDKSPPSAEKKINIDDNIRILLGSLPKADQPKLFGAFKVGFDRLLDIGREQMLIKSSSIQKIDGNSQVVKFESILSLNKPKLYEDQQKYSSLIMSSQYDCVNQSIMITRKEYKEDLFGTGKTIVSLSKKDGSPNDFKPFKSENINTFILRTACENLPVVAKEKNSPVIAGNISTPSNPARTLNLVEPYEQKIQAPLPSSETKSSTQAKLEQPNNINFEVAEKKSEPLKNLDETSNMVKDTLVVKPQNEINSEADLDKIRDQINLWKSAWAQKNIQQYIQMYSATYAPEGKSHQEWLDQRTIRINKAARIEILLEDIKIKKQGQKYIVSFVQNYSSDQLKEKSSKTLEWEKEGSQQIGNKLDQWVIVREISQTIR